MPKLNTTNLTVAGLLLLGALLRFYGFWSWSLTNDELSALSRIRFSSFNELLSNGVAVDGHPAFTQVFLYYWTKLAGNSVFAIRLPFVIAGIGSLYYFLKLSSTWLNRYATLIALSIFSVSHLFVLYSQIARPYSFGVFFILAFAYHWYNVITNRSTKSDFAGFVLFGLLSMLTHYFAGLMYFILLIYGFFKTDNSNKLKYAGLALLSGLLFLPHLSITLTHFKMGGVSWLPEPEGAYILIFLKFVFNNSELFLYTIYLVFIVGFLKSGFSFISKKTIALLLLFFIPYFIAYFYSIHISPLLQFSVLIFFTPFLVLGIASVIQASVTLKQAQILAALLTLTGIISLVFQLHFFKQKRFANFKEVAELSIKWEKEIGKQHLVTLANFADTSYINYYIDKFQSSFKYDVAQFDTITKQALAQQLIKKNNPDYVLVAFANVPVPKAVHELIKQDYPVVAKHQRFFNSEVILYSQSTQNREKLFTTNYLQLNNPKWTVNQSFLQDSTFYTDSLAYYLSPETEYALTYRDTVKNLYPENHNELSVTAVVKSKELNDLKLVSSIERDGEVIFWEALDCRDFQSAQDWFKISSVISKNKEILPMDQLSVYFWNPANDSAYIDDFEISNYADSDYKYYEY